MNRTHGLQTVRLAGGGWLLSLVGVALLAFVAGMAADSLRRHVPLQAEAQTAPAAVAARLGIGTGSVYDGSAPHVLFPNQGAAPAATQHNQVTDLHDRHAGERRSNIPAHAERSWLPPRVAYDLDRQAAKPTYSIPPRGMTDHLATQP